MFPKTNLLMNLVSELSVHMEKNDYTKSLEIATAIKEKIKSGEKLGMMDISELDAIASNVISECKKNNQINEIVNSKHTTRIKLR